MLAPLVTVRSAAGPLPAGLSTALDVGDRFVTRNLAGTPDRVAAARRTVSRAVGALHPLRDTVRLLVTELVADAVREPRAGEPGGALVLTLVVSRRRVSAQVRDAASVLPPRVADPGARPPEAVGGRGVALVDRLADRWAHDPETGTVWFEVTSP